MSHAASNDLVRLSFDGVYRVTWRQAGCRPYRFIGMAPKVRACKVGSRRLGVSARWIVNSSERFEQRATGMLYRRAKKAELVCEPDMHGVVRTVVFEPLTMKLFDAMSRTVIGFRELKKQLTSDELVRVYFWFDWVPDYWADAAW